MGKYASWAELEARVPRIYEDSATPEAFLTGMRGIAPPGMKPKPERGEHYGAGTRGKGPVVVERYKEAMFTR